MNRKILITGPPRCGKSTLISKLIEYYTIKKNYTIYGFLTPEVKKSGNRIGFDIVDIFSGDRSQLARVGDFKTKFKLGKYSIFIDEFENYLETTLLLERKTVDLIIIDEIGKMELFSSKFHELIKKLFQSDIPIIATIGQKIQHPVKNYILKIPEVYLFELNRKNQDDIFQKISTL